MSLRHEINTNTSETNDVMTSEGIFRENESEMEKNNSTRKGITEDTLPFPEDNLRNGKEGGDSLMYLLKRLIPTSHLEIDS